MGPLSTLSVHCGTLPSIAFLHFGSDSIPHCRFILTPLGRHEVVWRRIPTDSFDHHRRRGQLQELNDRSHIIVTVKHGNFTTLQLIGELCVFDCV
jgi:hypothetical protein